MEKETIFIDVETMRRNANKHFAEGRNCAQTTLLAISSVAGSPLSEEEILAITSGFVGGIGNTYDEGPCAALIAGVMFLGIHYGKNTRTIEMSREVYQNFKAVYGSPQCGKVIGTARIHECVGCCITVIDKIADMMANEESARRA